MTISHPAIAYEPGVVPEPLAKPANPIQFLRLLRDNQLSVYSREAFVAGFSEKRLFFHNFVLVNEPDFIEHILVTNHQNYVKGRLTRQILQPALGNSLLISDGDFWRRQRRIMAPAFHHQHIAQAADVMVRRARQRVGRWQTTCERGERLDITHEMMSLTMEIVAEGAVLQRHFRLNRRTGTGGHDTHRVLWHAESTRHPRLPGMVPTMAVAAHPLGTRSARPDDLRHHRHASRRSGSVG